MLSMQEFQEWLSSTTETSEAYQRYLADLTRASLTEILNMRSDLGWTFWTTDRATYAE